MVKPNRFRRRLAHFTLKATLYGSWILGLFPFTFDPRKRQLHSSRWLLAYGLVLNTSLLVISLLPASEERSPVKVEVYERNPLVKQIEFVVEIISLATTLVSHLRIIFERKKLMGLLNELLQLENRHFSLLETGDCERFDKYVIQKGLLIILEVGSSLLIYLVIPEGKVVLMEVVVIYVIQFELLLVVSHFHMAVLYIYRFVWTINGQLLKLANKMRRGEPVDPDRVHLLLQLYVRLLDLNDRLASIYDIQITLFMATLMAANIIISYVLIILYINNSRYSILIMILGIPQSLIVNFWDLWLSIATCDLAETTGRKTSTILKLFNDMGSPNKELEQRITEFTLFCSHRRLRYRHCGLFYVNYEMGFHMIITNILYVLFLAQFDYVNLKYK
ncbi:hypothetical protein KR009_007505 [Drosophila setifemur]|nr:hypothetical protein KR009_007505 [Drosophila setifemur]